nr:ubiquitin-conjugating enzyme e2 j1 [Quercus suber]
MSSKGPSVKRILKEASELASQPSNDYHAAPLESDLYEWHFTLRGPPAPSPFAGGLYHGRIILPPAYPLKPPSFRFVTPTGRFEVNREICLSISGHHEESWQPAWGIRTALVAYPEFHGYGGGWAGGWDGGERECARAHGGAEWRLEMYGVREEQR